MVVSGGWLLAKGVSYSNIYCIPIQSSQDPYGVHWGGGGGGSYDVLQPFLVACGMYWYCNFILHIIYQAVTDGQDNLLGMLTSI